MKLKKGDEGSIIHECGAERKITTPVDRNFALTAAERREYQNLSNHFNLISKVVKCCSTVETSFQASLQLSESSSESLPAYA